MSWVEGCPWNHIWCMRKPDTPHLPAAHVTPSLGLLWGILPWQQPPCKDLSCLGLPGSHISSKSHLCFSAQSPKSWSENSCGVGLKIALPWPCPSWAAVPRRPPCSKVTSLHGTSDGLTTGLGVRVWLHLCGNFPGLTVLFRTFWMLVSWARSPAVLTESCQMWSKPSEGTGEVCVRRAYILCAYSWSIPLFLLPCWFLCRAEIEDSRAPHPGETPATGASVLQGKRGYLKSIKLRQEAEQLCCFGLVGTKIAVSRLIPLQIWIWASTNLCSSAHLWR